MKAPQTNIVSNTNKSLTVFKSNIQGILKIQRDSLLLQNIIQNLWDILVLEFNAFSIRNNHWWFEMQRYFDFDFDFENNPLFTVKRTKSIESNDLFTLK